MLLEKHISLLKCGPVIYFKLEMEQNGPEIEKKKTDLMRQKSGYKLVPEFAIYWLLLWILFYGKDSPLTLQFHF